MLAQNSLDSGNTLKFFGGLNTGSHVTNNTRGSWSIPNALCFGENVSWPQGCNDSNAIRIQVENLSEYGNLAVEAFGEGFNASIIEGAGELAVTLVGEGTLLSLAEEAHERSITLQGVGLFATDLDGLGECTVTLDAGARPSAYDIAQEVWQAQQSSFTVPGSMGKTLADMDAVALAEAILSDPRFLTVAKYLGLR